MTWVPQCCSGILASTRLGNTEIGLLRVLTCIINYYKPSEYCWIAITCAHGPSEKNKTLIDWNLILPPWFITETFYAHTWCHDVQLVCLACIALCKTASSECGSLGEDCVHSNQETWLFGGIDCSGSVRLKFILKWDNSYYC